MSRSVVTMTRNLATLTHDLSVQMKNTTTKNMASILNQTDSAYYPCFKSMFRNVVAAMNEALDISLHLKPLRNHFKVSPLHTP